MQLITKVQIPFFDFKINYSHNLMFFGSCFTENIGNKFKNNFFNTIINPFGVVYNPLSILQNFGTIIDKKLYTENDLFFHNDLWHSFGHHSSFSGRNKNDVLQKINRKIEDSQSFLKNSDFLFVTFGTAWVYELVVSGRVVANCHKLPENFFNRRLLSVNEIIEFYSIFFDNLKKKNNKLNIILTVSPVRHLKDGAFGNQISKATLLLAVKGLIDKFDFVKYFPAYEIVMDELRDYRFYTEDMTHINYTAIDYIWEKIVDSLIDRNILSDMNIAKKLFNASHHRIFNEKSAEFLKFFNSTSDLYQKLKKNQQNADLREIENYLREISLLIK